MTSTEVNKLLEPYIDLGNLLLIDQDPIEGLQDLNEEGLKELTRNNAQYLFNKIWTLPRKVVQDATCAQLPECEYALPREKPIPKPREPTKWEKFAKEKGILKKKKDKKVFDEKTQEWKPRYGYRRADGEKKDWLIEIPDQADPYADYFSQRSDAKRERYSKQEVQRLRNVARAEKLAMNPYNKLDDSADKSQINQNHKEPTNKFNANMKADNKFTAKNKVNLKRQSNTNGPLGLGPIEAKSRQEIGHQLNRAKIATASMGKFQSTLKGEKPPKNMGLKRKFEPNEGNVADEKKRQIEILDKMKSKKPKLAESRFNAVNEHIKREVKRKLDTEDDVETSKSRKDEMKRRVGRTSGRSKSRIDSQRWYQKAKKGGFSSKSKAGKAAARGSAKSRRS